MDLDSASNYAETDPYRCQATAQLLISLCLSVASTAVAVAECTAAGMGFAAGCSAVSRHLVAAGVALLLGCAPAAVRHVVEALSLGDSVKARLLRRQLLLRLAEAEGRLEPGPRATAASACETTVQTVTGSGTPTSQAEAAPAAAAAAAAALVVENDTNLATSAEVVAEPLLADGEKDSELDADLQNWLRREHGACNFRLINQDSFVPSVIATVKRFAYGVYGLYRPNPSPEVSEQRQLVTLLIFLPVSCAYALPIYQLLYTQRNPLPASCLKAAPSQRILMYISSQAVWLRLGAVGLAVLICLVCSVVSLLRRRLRNLRTVVRLRQEKPPLFTRIFGFSNY